MSDTDTAGKLAKLRSELRNQGLDGFIVPHGDEFQNEYPPANTQRLEFLTGFTGSAGSAVVLGSHAALFVDGRYTLQAAREVPGEVYQHCQLAVETPSVWLARTVTAGQVIGYDPWLHTPDQVEKLASAVERAGATLRTVTFNPIDAFWTDRPAAPAAPVLHHQEQYAGESSDSKRTRIGKFIFDQGADAALITDVPSIAWLLNVRGGDIPHISVVLSYAVLHADGSVDWLLNPDKLNGMTMESVRIHKMESLAAVLSTLNGKTVMVESGGKSYVGGVTAGMVDLLRQIGATIRVADNPCALPKACKNAVELAGSRAAHFRDGLALTKFLAWFSGQDKETLDELAVTAKLEEFRAADPLYRGPSFNTISGSGPNGAIVHYHATEATNRKLDMGSLLLLDSGGQYPDGTTDITRTLPIGKPTPEMREMFTLVLKGHIALATMRFPRGTNGRQLDTIARQFLWKSGRDYAHGTGHGIGSYLSVHEGPQRCSSYADPVALQPGMIISNEPGYYQSGDFGIRIENLMTVRESDDGYLEFETLSYVPIDTRMIVIDMLTRDERTWVNLYHIRTLERFLPLLEGRDARWLQHVCTPM